MGSVGRRLCTIPLPTFERIYRNNVGRVRWVVRARGVPESAVDDVVHDVFLSVHRRLPERDRAVPLSTWICGVARSVAFSHRRASARRRRRASELPVPPQPLRPDQQLEQTEAWEALARFLDTLPDSQREVFVLAELVGLSTAEIGRTTGIKTNTLYSRLRLARARFAVCFPGAEDPRAAAGLLREAKRGEQPPAARRQGAWAALALQLGHPTGTAGGSAAVAAATAGWKGVALGTLGALGIAVAWQAGGSSRAGGPPAHARRSSATTVLERVEPGEGARTAAGSAEIGTKVGAEPPLLAPGSTTRAADGRAHATPRPVVPHGHVGRPVDEPSAHERRAPPGRVGHRPGAPEPPGPAEGQPERSTVLEPVDPLEAEVQALREARSMLAQGRATDALARLDRDAAILAAGVLTRERRAVEREAACRAADAERAARAAAALGRAGDPCDDVR